MRLSLRREPTQSIIFWRHHTVLYLGIVDRMHCIAFFIKALYCIGLHWSHWRYWAFVETRANTVDQLVGISQSTMPIKIVRVFHKYIFLVEIYQAWVKFCFHCLWHRCLESSFDKILKKGCQDLSSSEICSHNGWSHCWFNGVPYQLRASWKDSQWPQYSTGKP